METKVEIDNFKKQKIITIADAVNFARNFYSDDIELYESLFIMILDHEHNVIGYYKISRGGVVGKLIDIKIITKIAIESSAAKIILFHNHPSGQYEPSQEDIDITKKIIQALSLFEITLIDHIILTKSRFSSIVNGITLRI